MAGKKFIARVLALICLIAAAVSLLFLLVPASRIDSIPYAPTVQYVLSLVIPYTELSFVPPGYQIYLIPAILLLSSLLFLLLQKTFRFLWIIPGLYIVYYTVFIFLRLHGGFSTPGSVLAVLGSNPFIGQVLMVLALVLEGTIGLLLLYVSIRIGRKLKVRYPEKEVNVKTKEQKENRKKEIRKKENRKAGKAGKKKAEEMKKASKDTPVAEQPVTVELDEDAPLSFPSLKDVPDMPSVGVTKEKGIYVGRLNELSDSSLVLTDVPVDEEELAEETEEKSVRRAPLQALYEHLEKDRMTKDFTVPTSVPPIRPSNKKKAADEKLSTEEPVKISENASEMAPEQAPEKDVKVAQDPPEPKNMKAQQVPAEEPAVPAVEESDDIDFVSGVGGLVRDTSSALLSRGKIGYKKPSEELLDSYPNHSTEVDEETKLAGQRLMETLREFKIEAKIADIIKGPTVTMYEVTLAPGVRVSSIINLSDNIAMELAAQRVRIVAPIPGKQAVGIEVPNPHRSIIGFRDLLGTVDNHKTPHLPMILGRKITGEPVVVDIARTPHLLIAGATGSGKSVCVNALINSLLYLKSPKEVRLILVDPKIVELRMYNGIPHLLTPVITEPKKTIKALEFCLYEMDRRYKMLNSLAVRNISAYNSKVDSQKIARERLPYIVVVIDEFADIMTTVGKELETILARLAAMARAVGIHLVLATQRPSSDVITGTIKSNIPSRIAFTVSGQINSRIIIDENGAEKLLGQGDMLLAPGWEPNSTRIQGAFLSDDEVERVVSYVKTQGEPDYLDESFFEDEVESSDDSDDDLDDDSSDEALREKAIKIIIERQGASASYLQRRLRIGYNKAARIIELLEEEGVVGPSRGSKPRELLRIPD